MVCWPSPRIDTDRPRNGFTLFSSSCAFQHVIQHQQKCSRGTHETCDGLIRFNGSDLRVSSAHPHRFVCLQTQACLASIGVVQSDIAEARMKLAKVTGWLRVETDEGEREALDFAQQSIRRRYESLSATMDYFLKRLDDLGVFVGLFNLQLNALCTPWSFFLNRNRYTRSPCISVSLACRSIFWLETKTSGLDSRTGGTVARVFYLGEIAAQASVASAFPRATWP